MAQSNVILSRTFGLSSDHNNLSSNTTGAYKFVRASDADHQVGQVLTTGDIAVGVTQEPRKKDEDIAVALLGITKIRCDTTVPRFRHVMAHNSGHATPFLGAGHAAGFSLQAGATGDVIEMVINSVGFMATTEAV